jgi:hypothetical protein
VSVSEDEEPTQQSLGAARAGEPTAGPGPTPEPEPTPEPKPSIESKPGDQPGLAGEEAPDPLASLPVGAQPLLAAAFDALTRSSVDLRRASIYVGLVTLALVGPVAFLFWAQLVAVSGGGTAFLRRSIESHEVALLVTSWFAIAALPVVLIESQGIAIALLGGRISGRPLALHEALQRSRQVFWRILRARILLTGPLVALELTVLPSVLDLPATVGWAFVTAPFVYWPTGIVIGDVAAVEALRRSVRIARARWRLAFLLAGFSLLADFLSFFGVAAGESITGRLALLLGLGPEGGSVAIAVTTLIIGALILALGSLVLTVSAISNAPQVVAFLALTRYTGGLDRARDRASPETPDGRQRADPTFRWIPRPMRIAIALALLALVIGLREILQP